MRTLISAVSLCLLLVLAGVIAFYLPEPLMRDGVKWAHRAVFAGGIFSAALYKIVEFVKGDTKKLLKRDSLTDLQKLKLAKTIHRRSRYLWGRFLMVLGITAASYGCLYFSGKEYAPHYLLRVSFLLVCVAFWAFIPVFMAWRDYEKAKEILDTRDCDVPDIE
jgi:hypothetical protein